MNRKKLFLFLTFVKIIFFRLLLQTKKKLVQLALGKSNDAATIASDEETTQHKHQHSIEAAGRQQSGHSSNSLSHTTEFPFLSHASNPKICLQNLAIALRNFWAELWIVSDPMLWLIAFEMKTNFLVYFSGTSELAVPRTRRQQPLPREAPTKVYNYFDYS